MSTPQIPDGATVSYEQYRYRAGDPEVYTALDFRGRLEKGNPPLRPEEHMREDGIPLDPRGGVTVARLTDDETGVILGHGEAWCSPWDNFNRKLGKTIALGRALKQLRAQPCRPQATTHTRPDPLTGGPDLG